jgi:hypothetical protein
MDIKSNLKLVISQNNLFQENGNKSTTAVRAVHQLTHHCVA